MSDIRERWRTSLIEGTTDWAAEHEHVADVFGRLIWGTDTGAFYREIARLPELPTGTKVLDIPVRKRRRLEGASDPSRSSAMRRPTSRR